MTLVLGLKIIFWLVVFAIGGGLIRYDKYGWNKKIVIGLPGVDNGSFFRMGPSFTPFTWMLFRLFLTLVAIGIIRGSVYLLGIIFHYTLF